MPYPAKAIANYFLDLAERSGKSLDPMQLQKLVYFAHGWYLALTDKPLLEEHIEAWKYGPVVPTLYHEFKEWGSGSIKKRATDMRFVESPVTGRKTVIRIVEPSLDDGPDVEYVKNLLNRVWDIYGKLSAVQLSQLTHEPGGPWEKTRTANPDRRGTDIPDDLIKSYFVAKAKANEPVRS